MGYKLQEKLRGDKTRSEKGPDCWARSVSWESERNEYGGIMTSCEIWLSAVRISLQYNLKSKTGLWCLEGFAAQTPFPAAHNSWGYCGALEQSVSPRSHRGRRKAVQLTWPLTVSRARTVWGKRVLQLLVTYHPVLSNHCISHCRVGKRSNPWPAQKFAQSNGIQ